MPRLPKNHSHFGSVQTLAKKKKLDRYFPNTDLTLVQQHLYITTQDLHCRLTKTKTVHCVYKLFKILYRVQRVPRKEENPIKVVKYLAKKKFI